MTTSAASHDLKDWAKVKDRIFSAPPRQTEHEMRSWILDEVGEVVPACVLRGTMPTRFVMPCEPSRCRR